MPASAETISAIWRTVRLDLPASSSSSIVLTRSSHSLALLGSKAYIFGGELKPRTPVGSELLEVDLSAGGGDGGGGGAAAAAPAAQTRVLSSSNAAPWPQPRVGAALCSHGDALYLWGGRGGKEMAPLSVRGDPSAAQGDSETEIEDVWRFTPSSSTWELLTTSGQAPEGRSYHTLAVADGNLFVHAGCPAKGRLNTLHSLSLKDLTWKKLPDAPGNGRGGTVLAAIPGKGGKGSLLARWGGFCGYELGGPLDIFDPSTSRWTSHEALIHGSDSEPSKRSVHALVPIRTTSSALPTLMTSDGASHEAVALLGYGEGEGAPAELGHDGAGKFLSDLYLLLRRTSSGAEEGSEYSFLPLSPKGDAIPEPRGWFAFDSRPSSDGLGTSFFLYGGLNDKNERLDTAHELVVSF